MRFLLNNDYDSEKFSNFLLSIGNGTYPIVEKPFKIKLSEEFLTLTKSREELINSVYPNFEENYNNK